MKGYHDIHGDGGEEAMTTEQTTEPHDSLGLDIP